MRVSYNMDFSNTGNLNENGFTGFVTVESLWNDRSCIPKLKGVYLVLDHNGKPDFITPGVGGYFKGEDPNVSIAELNDNYVSNSLVVYIGKAGKLGGDVTLQSRLSQYLSFGRGNRVSHRGGRLIWQLKEHRNLVFCWKPTPDDDPREVEKLLIDNYEKQYGKKPFANLAR